MSYQFLEIGFQDSALTASAQYTQWATDLGVSPVETLINLDGDDLSLPFTLASACVFAGATNAEFSTEGMIGWSQPVKQNNTVPTPFTRMYYAGGVQPDSLVAFRFSLDCKATGVKLQKLGGVTIIGGDISPLSGGDGVLSFAVRFPDDLGFPTVVFSLRGTIPATASVLRTSIGDVSGCCSASIPTGNTTLQPTLLSVTITTRGFGTDLSRVNTIPTVNLATQGMGDSTGRINTAPMQALDGQGVRRIALLPILGKRDIYFGGVGQVAGTVKNTPATPVRRRVLLIEEATRAVIRETWSEAATGVYAFERVAMNTTYTVLSYDHTQAFRAVVADRVMPELMPELMRETVP